MAGFRELLAVDFDRNSVETFRQNFPEVPVWMADIKEITAERIMKSCGIVEKELDVLDGSPPCQGFSLAGKRKVSDKRNDLFLEFVRILKGIKPKVFVMENVTGLVYGKMRGMFKEIIRTLKDTDYNVKCKMLNAKYYGVPQSRKRLFFIGVRKDIGTVPKFPKPSGKIITVKKALENLDTSKDKKRIYSGKNFRLVRKIREGKSMSDIHPKGWGYNLIRINRNKPCPTITKTFRQSQTGLLHYSGDRFLTISELKRLATFPDDFRFVGTFEEKWARIGNSVMPRQMFAIAKTIRDEILGN